MCRYRRMALKKTSRECAHVDPPLVDGETIRSGACSAPLVHRGEHASIAEGEDGSLWILVHDPERRPRGRDPGIVVESADVRYEHNGLVRVLDRRVSRDSIERLIGDLTGQGTRITGSLTTLPRIPAGNYAGIVVETLGEHYRVQASGAAARRLSDLQSLGAGRWLVLAGEESRLRRELVRQLMPLHRRMLWGAVRNGPRILIALAAASAALSILVPAFAWLALAALVALGALHRARRAINARARRRWVEPYVGLTRLPPSEA